MSSIGKLVGLANALESLWTFYTLFGGFTFGVFATLLPYQPAPWWLGPAILLQIVFAAILLWVALGLVGPQWAFPLGAIVSLGMLFTFIAMFGLVPTNYLDVGIVLCIIAVVGNAFALFRARSSL